MTLPVLAAHRTWDRTKSGTHPQSLTWFIGIGPFLLVHLPIALLAGSVGVWLFYIQHQFEETFWVHGGEWNFHEASLRGSSHCDLPGILRWFTANIGVHHVHHLCSRIP
jgi:acyl-lipid omega-6 desaturase (Delta-12 desaturase)